MHDLSSILRVTNVLICTGGILPGNFEDCIRAAWMISSVLRNIIYCNWSTFIQVPMRDRDTFAVDDDPKVTFGVMLCYILLLEMWCFDLCLPLRLQFDSFRRGHGGLCFQLILRPEVSQEQAGSLEFCYCRKERARVAAGMSSTE